MNNNIAVQEGIDYPYPNAILMTLPVSSYEHALALAHSHCRPGAVVVYGADCSCLWIVDLSISGAGCENPTRMSFIMVHEVRAVEVSNPIFGQPVYNTTYGYDRPMYNSSYGNGYNNGYGYNNGNGYGNNTPGVGTGLALGLGGGLLGA
jgi:hypothetical protein